MDRILALKELQLEIDKYGIDEISLLDFVKIAIPLLIELASERVNTDCNFHKN